MKVLIERIMFLVKIRWYLQKCLLNHSQDWVCLEKVFRSSNVKVFVMECGIERIFTNFLRSR